MFLRHPRQTLVCLLLALPLTTACALAPAASANEQLQIACRADSASTASLPHIQVLKVAASPGDLSFYEARSSATGNSVRIYHETDLEVAAASKAACLMGALDLLSAELPHWRGPLRWSPLVLTHSENYIPPKRDGERRWSTTFSAATWDADTLRFLLVVMPHEETHLSQGPGVTQLPRWFAEGHAEWAGLLVTEQLNPGLAASERARNADAARMLGPAHLSSWGGLSVKPEAIDRQLNAADRERRMKDPTFVPPGPYKFGPGDFAEDNSNEPGRYGAAHALFAGLEQRHGRAAVSAWVSAVLASQDSKQIEPLARQMLNEELGPLLE